MSIFTISNFTRYNTNDLEALFNYVEARVVAQGNKSYMGASFQPSPNKWRTPKDSLFIAIKEYNPQGSGPYYSFVKGHAYSTDPDLGILSPDKLVSSPVERIAAAHTKPMFPKHGCADLASRIYNRYDTTGMAAEPKWVEFADLPTIQIEDKPSKKVDIVERHRVARKLSKGSLAVAEDFLKRAKNHYADMSKSVGSGLKHLTKSKIELSSDELELQKQVTIAEHQINYISTLLSKLTTKDS